MGNIFIRYFCGEIGNGEDFSFRGMLESFVMIVIHIEFFINFHEKQTVRNHVRVYQTIIK